jgi:hypothetical protein
MKVEKTSGNIWMKGCSMDEEFKMLQLSPPLSWATFAHFLWATWFHPSLEENENLSKEMSVGTLG